MVNSGDQKSYLSSFSDLLKEFPLGFYFIGAGICKICTHSDLYDSILGYIQSCLYGV